MSLQTPILDALPAEPPYIPPLPLDALPAREPLTAWRLVCVGLGAVGSACEWAFGVVALIVGLAFLAAVPLLGLLSLGYLLEAGARIARNRPQRDEEVRRRRRWAVTRYFRSARLALADALVGARRAARVGGVVLGVALMILPLQLVSSLYATAEVIDPGGAAARGWRTALAWLAIAAGVHIALACLHGGKLRHFFWPVGNLIWLARQLLAGPVRCYVAACDATWEFVGSLRLPYCFWLGARGFAVGLAWLVVPITLLAVGRRAPVVGVVGAFWLTAVLLVLPLLQMRFAVERRFRAGFELGAALTLLGRAPWAWALAQVATLLLSLPLYLFKIEFIPSEVGGLPSVFVVLVSLVFVLFILPTRLLAGWAYARSERRGRPAHPLNAAAALLLMLPGTAAYVGFVYLTQYVSWKGFASLYEQHAFLLPVPFPGW